MKFAKKIFPKGTFKGQETDGAYLDKTLAKNLDILAKKIADDMHFLIIISGHDMVRDGKTTLMTQIGTYLTWKINKLHGTKNTFTDKNLVFKTSHLEKRSFELDRLNVIASDEGDELTTHSMKELSVNLRRYFRKCGQLNQIVILILPSFFELPKFFALNRSHLLLDVYFSGTYDRGFFKFYSPKAKKLLYLKGKRTWDYDAQRHDFKGRFFSSYCFFPDLEGCVRRYKDNKRYDLMHEDTPIKTEKDIIRDTTITLFQRIHQNLNKISVKELSEAFGFSTRTGFAYLNEATTSEKTEVSRESVGAK